MSSDLDGVNIESDNSDNNDNNSNDDSDSSLGDMSPSNDSDISEAEIAQSRKGLATPRVSLTEIKEILKDLDLNINQSSNNKENKNNINNNNNNILNNIKLLPNKRRNSITLDNDNDNNNNNDDEKKNINNSKIKETKKVKRHKIDKKVYVNQYLCYKYLGSGAFGKVLLAKNITNNKKYAIKILNKTLLKRKKILRKGKRPITMLDNIFREIAIMKKLTHPNIVRLYEVIDDPDNEKLYLIIEYCPYGNVLGEGGSKEKCEPMKDHELIRQYMRDIILGLDYLHKNNIIHGDIKPENLLIGGNNKKKDIKIADFGVSFFLDNETSPNNDGKIGRSQGTPAFSPPEANNKLFDANPTDIWAVGVTLYMMITGICPFVGKTMYDTYEKIQDYQPPIPTNINENMKDFLIKILDKNPLKRINTKQMFIHPWITNNGKQPLIHPKIGVNNNININNNDIENAINIEQNTLKNMRNNQKNIKKKKKINNKHINENINVNKLKNNKNKVFKNSNKNDKNSIKNDKQLFKKKSKKPTRVFKTTQK